MSDYITFNPPIKHLEKQFDQSNKALIKAMRKQFKGSFVKSLIPLERELLEVAEKHFATGTYYGAKWTPAFSTLKKKSKWYAWKAKSRKYERVIGTQDTRMSYTGAIEKGYYSSRKVKGNQKDGFTLDIIVGNTAAHFQDFERGTGLGYKWSTLPNESKQQLRVIDDRIDEAYDRFIRKVEGDFKKRRKR
jgi:hypothetical protein